MKLCLFLLLLFLVSCATRTPVTDKLTRNSEIAPAAKIQDVPLIRQKDKQCGPAALSMVLQHYGLKKTPDMLAVDLFQKDLKGSFRSDVLASARREGMMAIEVNDLKSALEEVSAGNPVIVFQNLAFSLLPQWHFSVLTGYELKGPDVYLHSGKDEVQKMDMRLFERSWILGGKWGAVVLPPYELSVTSSEMDHVEAASLLEKIGKLSEAGVAYETILKRWPDSFLSYIGLANISYSLKNLPQAEKHLISAVRVNPKSSIAWHNLALVQEEKGEKVAARKSARQALRVVDKENEKKFRINLHNLLSDRK